MNKLVGFTYNKGGKTSNYIYRRNIQGDIIGIYDSLGNEVGGYAYDAYGKCYVKYKDNSSEWVWIEVPKTTVFSDLAIDTTKELTEQNYEDIKNKLISYATTYRSSWTDEWYNGCGMTSDEYTAAYQKMLKSVYTYGGFWIGSIRR